MGDISHDDRELDRSLRSLPATLDRGPIADLRRALVKNRLLSTHPSGVRTGRFTVLRQIGGGAMGAVFEAYDEILERKIALKLVRAEDEEAKSRAAREARALAKLNHPQVITVHEIGEHQGQLFIAMELVAGETLEEWLKQRARGWEEILAVFSQAGRGLAAAHAGGVIHRDFKPANAMIGDDGRVRVVDFGLAMKREELTISCGAGTPGFIAPEQLRGGEANERSDQFSFAVALHRALFDRSSGLDLDRPSRRCPAAIEEVLRRGFDGDPEKRWPSIAAMLNMLDRAANAQLRRNKRARTIAGATFVLLFFVGILAFDRRNSADGGLGDRRARDRRLVARAQQLSARDPRAAAAALLEVEDPKNTEGWRSEAISLLQDVPLIAHLPLPARRSELDERRGSVLSFISGQGWISWTFDQGGFRIVSEDIEDQLSRYTIVRADGAISRRRPDGALEILNIFPKPPRAIEAGFPPRRAVFSADDRTLALWDDSDIFWIVSTDGLAEPRAFHNPEGEILSLAINSDGSQLLTGPARGPARLWTLDGGASKILGHGGGIFGAEFSPDGTRAVTAAHDRTVRVWELEAGRSFDLNAHPEGVIHLSFSADGQRVATSATDGVRIFDLRVPARAFILSGHEGQIWSASLSHDRARLATAAFDGTARVWDLDGARPPLVLRGHAGSDVYAAIFSDDDRLLATGGDDGTARVWSLDSGEQRHIFSGHSQWVYGLAFSPDGRWLATGDKSGSLRLWPLGMSSPDLAPEGARVLEPGCTIRTRRLDSITFSADGSQVAAQACGCAGDTCVFRLDELELAGRLTEAAPFDPRALIFLNDGRLAIPFAPGALHLWRPGEARSEPTFSAREGRIFAMAASPDGRRIATASSDGAARVFDVARPNAIAVLGGHEDWVVGVRFDPSGRRVVTASYDGTARVFDLERPGEPIVLRGHTDKLRFAEFANEDRVVTASFDGTVRVWHVDLDEEVSALRERLRH